MIAPNVMSSKTFPLRDLRVRRALNYAINKEELLRYAFIGNAVEMKGILTEKSGVDLSDTRVYDWNIPKARALLEEAGYGGGLNIAVFYFEKDYLIAQLLERFYSLLDIKVEMTPVGWEWIEKHLEVLKIVRKYTERLPEEMVDELNEALGNPIEKLYNLPLTRL